MKFDNQQETIRGSKQQDKINAALFDAQGDVEPVYKTKSARSPARDDQEEGDTWDYAAHEDVSRVSKKALRAHRLSFYPLKSVVRETGMLTTFRLVHVPSGQWQEIEIEWPRYQSNRFNDVPLACSATFTHERRTLLVSLLQIPILPKSAAESASERMESAVRPSFGERPTIRAVEDAMSDAGTWWTSTQDEADVTARLAGLFSEWAQSATVLKAMYGRRLNLIDAWRKFFPDQEPAVGEGQVMSLSPDQTRALTVRLARELHGEVLS